MLTLELGVNTTRMNVTSRIVVILLRRQLMQNHLILNLAMRKARNFDMKKYIRQVKSYVDNNLLIII